MSSERLDFIRSRIRDVPNFPKPGIVFKDITPLLLDPRAFEGTIALMADRAAAWKPACVAAIESRGFIFGGALAQKLGVGFVPLRKPGKLPYRTRRKEYALEYGTDALEVHEDAVIQGQNVLVVDDVLATGGTAGAACELLEAQGAQVVGCVFLIELSFLDGRKKLGTRRVESLLAY